MRVTILWDAPQPLLLCLLHLVSREIKGLQIEKYINHFDCIVIGHRVASLFSPQIQQKQKFLSCTSDLISTGTVYSRHRNIFTVSAVILSIKFLTKMEDVVLLLLLSFCVSSAGCHVFLPGGAELLFPPGCLVSSTRLEWAEKRPERKWVRLEEHDILLSRPLELRPHGITFLKV